MRRARRLGGLEAAPVALAVIALSATLAGCTAGGSPSPTPTSPPTSSPTSTPTAPVPTAVTPETPVVEARQVFDAVNGRTLSANPRALGPDFIAGLEAAGFPRAQLEVTSDTTSVGLEPGSIQFAARWGDTCFIGQNGSGSDGYRSESVPVLATGKCLIGSTRPIG